MTAIESMGCGVPVIRYDNAMWQALLADSGAGWVVPMGDRAALAAEIARLSRARDAVAKAATVALRFAQAHDFETEFSARIRHLSACLMR
jgi:colanic acid/amylovoran biosynthesis glycosyltransferase